MTPVPTARLRLRERIRGLYLITPDAADTDMLHQQVGQALQAGARLLQYRNKTADAARRREQIEALLALCARHDALLVVNDDWQLARSLGATAIHLGRDDGDPALVRREVGESVLIGVSCYADADRARRLAPSADYVAFGSLFPSRTKPQAPGAALGLLAQARGTGLPVVGIGGIDATNLEAVFDAGADAAALISAAFGEADIAAATRRLLDRVPAR